MFDEEAQETASIHCRGSEDDITWSGSTFEVVSADGSGACTGTVSDDGSMLLNLEAENSSTGGSDFSYSASCVISNVPLSSSQGISVSGDGVDATGTFIVEYSVEGRDAQSYVDTQRHHKEMSFGEHGTLSGTANTPGCPDLPSWSDGQGELTIEFSGTGS